MSAIPVLNVTIMPTQEKHATIFNYFDNLQEGEAFLILNDHNPKMFYEQLLSERGNTFTWEYLEDGPVNWRIQITKKLISYRSNDTVGSIVANDLRNAEVFKKLGIDFCYGGNKTLSEVAAEINISETILRAALSAVDDHVHKNLFEDYNKWEVDFLVDYIINIHHRYVKEASGIINELARKVTEHHGSNHPELYDFSKRVNLFLIDMLQHMEKEEKVLFPQIKSLVQHEREHKQGNFMKGIIPGGIKMMMQEHEVSGEDLRFFRKLTNNYTLPSDACNSYAYLVKKMEEFENALYIHIHLENNILFSKALVLEKEV
jgi:regulator of cell morphogenesis and NO signaling